jgi:hypothetical protein
MGSATRIGVLTSPVFCTRQKELSHNRCDCAWPELLFLRRQTLKPPIYSSLHFRQAKDSNDYQIYGNDVVQ